MRVAGPQNGKYELRRATMVDLIRTAYGVEADKVVGGPHWLEMDRFDIIAKTPSPTTPDTVKPMLQALLVERFGLVARQEIKPVPGHALTKGAGELKLKEAPGEWRRRASRIFVPPRTTFSSPWRVGGCPWSRSPTR